MLKMSCLKVNYYNLYLEDSALGEKKNLWCVWCPLLTFVMNFAVLLVRPHYAGLLVQGNIFFFPRKPIFYEGKVQFDSTCHRHCNKYSCIYTSRRSKMSSMKPSPHIASKEYPIRHFGKSRYSLYSLPFIWREEDSFTIQIASFPDSPFPLPKLKEYSVQLWE